MGTVGENYSGTSEYSNDNNKLDPKVESQKSVDTKWHDTKNEPDQALELFKNANFLSNKSEKSLTDIHGEKTHRNPELKQIETVVSHVQIIATPEAVRNPVHLLNASKVSHTPEEIEDIKAQLECAMSIYDVEEFAHTLEEALVSGISIHELIKENMITEAEDKADANPEFLNIIKEKLGNSGIMQEKKISPELLKRDELKQKSQELKSAILNGNVEKIKELLADAELSNLNMGFDPLLEALKTSNKELICLAAKFKGFDFDLNNINKQDENGLTPLLHAVKSPYANELAPFLCDQGANVNICDNKGCTPLMMACQKGRISTAKFLIEKGALVNVYDHEGLTPLHYAVRSKSQQIVKDLLEAKANPTLVDLKTGESPSRFALLGESKDENIFHLLNEAAPGFDHIWHEQSMLRLRFTTDPTVMIDSTPVRMTGYHFEFTYPELMASLQSNWTADNGSKIPDKAPPEWNESDTNAVLQAVEFGVESVAKDPLEVIDKMMEQIEAGGIVSVPTGWGNTEGKQDGHATGIVVSKNMLIKCNRGDRTQGEPGAYVYQLEPGQEFDRVQLRSVLLELMLNKDKLSNRSFYENELNVKLNLPSNPIYLRHKDQFAGNCPWAQAKLMFRAIMYAHLAKTDLANAAHYSLEMYKAWTSADRTASLNNFLSDLQKLPDGTSPTPLSKEETLLFILKRSAKLPEVSGKIMQELNLHLSQSQIEALKRLDKGGFKIALTQEDLERELRSNPIGTPILDADLVIHRKTKTGGVLKNNIFPGELPGKFIIDDNYLNELTPVELKYQFDLESQEAHFELRKMNCLTGYSYEDANRLYWDKDNLMKPILFPNNWLMLRKPDQAKPSSVHFRYDLTTKKFSIIGKEKEIPPMTAQELLQRLL